jgi:hypothetical protein
MVGNGGLGIHIAAYAIVTSKEIGYDIEMAMNQEYSRTGEDHQQFPQTEWTRIIDPKQREVILREFSERYWKPLHAYLRSKGFSHDQANDLVQGFFSEKVLGQELLQKADRTRGRLRNFLLTTIKNYAINIMKKEPISTALYQEAEEGGRAQCPEAEFDRAWAEELLQKVLKELEIECQRRGKSTHWHVFYAWLMDPTCEGSKNKMSKICATYSIPTASNAYNMIGNIKIRFRAILRHHLRQMVDSDAEVDGEIGEFINIFSISSTRF